MEYSGRHILDNRTEETLKKLNLQEPDWKIYKKVLKNCEINVEPLFLSHRNFWESLQSIVVFAQIV